MKQAIATKQGVRLSVACLLLSWSVLGQAQDARWADQPRQPEHSEIMPLADKAIVNDMTRAGDHLVAVGERGHILRSENGDNWQQVQAPVRAMLTRVTFVDARHGWAVGHDGSVLRTSDGGESWELRHWDAAWGRPFYDAIFTTPDRGLVVGSNGRMLRTDDGGESWEEVTNEVFDTGFHLYEIERLEGGALMIAGERGFMARSLDDGESWEMIEPPYIGSYFGVIPVGPHAAVLYGLQGKVFRAIDVRELAVLDDPMAYDPFINESVTDSETLASMGWQAYDNPVVESLFGGSLYDDDGSGLLVLVGVDGTIVTGRADQALLEPVQSPTDQPYSDVVVQADRLLMSSRTGMHTADKP
ncbi:WD40/YVTN/BNR-like repeat-containing protein [Algiphilus sp.]|uniref:WD40/YVTN/BNR-like repeat-containing protein n=1 Tax=Algiphilus sp. TaxID=1872431 RepID=UPI003B51BF5C